MNKYAQITEWIREYTPLHSWVFFNVTPLQPDNISVMSEQNERSLQQFIDGSRIVELLFTIGLCKEYDKGTSDNNLEAIEEFELISNWIEQQNLDRNLPDFGSNIIIETIEALENVPSSYVDSQTNIATYEGTFKITYLEKRKGD